MLGLQAKKAVSPSHILPSSASTPFQLQLRLSWFYFHLIQQPTHPPTHPPTQPATRRKSFNWNWRWVKSKGTDSRPPCDYFKLIYTKLQNWLKNTLTLRTLQCLKNWLYQPEFIYKNNANFKDSILLKFWLCGDNFNVTSQLFYDFIRGGGTKFPDSI